MQGRELNSLFAREITPTRIVGPCGFWVWVFVSVGLGGRSDFTIAFSGSQVILLVGIYSSLRLFVAETVGAKNETRHVNTNKDLGRNFLHINKFDRTMAMIIHGIPGSGNTTPIELLCSMAGVKMDMQVLAVWEGKQMEPAFLAINPVSPS